MQQSRAKYGDNIQAELKALAENIFCIRALVNFSLVILFASAMREGIN